MRYYNGKTENKLVVVLCMVLVMLVNPITSLAASSDTWSVNYAKNVPSTELNQTDYCTLAYYSDGYKATCSKLTGSTDRMIKITSSSAGGMSTVTMTTTGTSSIWKMKKLCKF